MQTTGRITLAQFLRDPTGVPDGASGDTAELGALLLEVAATLRDIAAMTTRGALGGPECGLADGGYLGALAQCNVQGETQKKLDLLAHEALVRGLEASGRVAGMASEEAEAPIAVAADPGRRRGRFLLVFDPLDGSSNTDVNISVGSIFSVLRHDEDPAPREPDFLQPGRSQVAAGYAIYGPATMLVLSLGRGTHGFTLDRDTGDFVLTHPALRIPETCGEFAINMSNARFWEPPVQRYVAECQAGRQGERGQDFNMRWIACLVAEVHRILMRGGVFLYPRDSREPRRPGRLRLLYEANPAALLIEQAGGLASTGRQRLQELQPESLHQRVPVILGCAAEVLRLERYHAEHDEGRDRPFASPLFSARSLFGLQPSA
ncbi:class 1 fructose-bisphosphatase [Pelomonas sp. CA6]|uniref:class 1 fructose-bisphosphatase n=1 Tax=Pelomonas sp. CA6 TaxID=2907999 RepID=UPI001F4B6A2B|nr:class 1 fructose-bisphosphatase [Pelomonas sp. CA6]MCH7342867.1 class 1 fructose-bisphosphatase [Pelomonas sp. CA6]